MEYIDWTAILIFCIIFLITILWYYKPSSDIPGPFSWPIFGNLFWFNKYNSYDNKAEFLERHVAKYGPMFRVFLGPYQVVFVNGYDLVSDVLHKKEFINRPHWLPGIKAVRKVTGGVGIAMADGEMWRERRRFSMKSMKDFGMGKASIEDRILEEVTNLVEDFGKQQGKPITDIKLAMTNASINVVHGIIFGFRYKHGEETQANLVRQMNKIFNGPTQLSARGVFPLLALLSPNDLKDRTEGFRGVKTYIDHQINEHRKSFDCNNIRDFVDLFLEAEQNQSEHKAVLDTNSLFNSITDLFAAGTDTTSSTLDWAVLYMIVNPDVQQKCQDEITKIVGERMIKLSDRVKLSYVEATIMEIQRVANIAPQALPHVSVCDTTLGGYNIPKQTILIPNLTSVHYDKSVWTDPDKFNPERFLNESNGLEKNEHWLPFSAGPRVCLGESLAKSEIFLIFANLIQRFTFSKISKDDKVSLEGKTSITRSAYPYRVVVKQR